MVWAFSSSDANGAHEAREQFLNVLKQCAPAAADYSSCELIFGELVGNVVQHAPGRIQISLDWTGEQALLCVEDSGSLFHFDPALPADPLAETGRGLYIVSALAGAINIKQVPGGKVIRVILPLTSAA